jgi:hypothetical protein
MKKTKDSNVIFKHRHVELWSCGLICCYSASVAYFLNRKLKRYDDGKYRFEERPEVIFRVPPDQIQSLQNELVGLGCFF